MWILPKNYSLSSAFAADMVESKGDLTLPGLDIEQSLMWRSKPSALPTWLRRWTPTSYLPHLFTRILKPCQWSRFETELTSLLPVIHVSPSQRRENVQEKKTQDTSGPTSLTSLEQLDLFDAFSRMSKDTSALDCEKSSAIWKALVIKRRGEYSARLKSAHRTRERESISWRTPSAQEPGITLDRLQTKDGQPPRTGERLYDKETGRNAQYGLSQQVQMAEHNLWPTPTANSRDATPRWTKTRNGKQVVEPNLAGAAKLWATPRTSDANGGARPLNDKGLRVSKSNQTSIFGAQLIDQVRHWPTPTTRDWKGGYNEASLNRSDGKSRRFDALPNAAIGGVGTDIVLGHLNPDWVEWLMGVPTGWTALGSWGTESCQQRLQKRGEC